MNRELLSQRELKKKSVKKWIAAAGIVLLAVLLTFLIIRFVEKRREAAYLEKYGWTALYVGKYEATYDLYRYFYLNYRAALAEAYPDDSGALDRAVRARVTEAAQGLYGSIALADDYGITPNDADVRQSAEEYIDATKAYFKENKLNFADELAQNYMTEEVFEFLMRVDALEDKLYERLLSSEGVIENDEVALLEILRGDSFVRAKQILLKTIPARMWKITAKSPRKHLKNIWAANPWMC